MGKLRDRDRDGWITEDKRTSPHRWVACCYTQESYTDQRGVLRYRVARELIGPKSSKKGPGLLYSKKDALEQWRKMRVKPASGAPVTKAETTFKQFLDTEFVPLRRSRWKSGTRKKLDYYFSLMLSDFGDEFIGKIEPKRLAVFIESVSKRMCKDTVTGCLTYLRAIFKVAVRQDFVVKDPCLDLKLPAELRERSRTTLTVVEIVTIEAVLCGADLILFRLMVRCGIRPGEVVAIKWCDLRADRTILISRSYTKGVLGEPKSKASKTTIVVPESLYNDLLELKDQSDDSSLEGWVFPAERKRKAFLMCRDAHNWLNRVLKPAGLTVGIKVTSQMLRRTFATLANDVGGNMKSVQRQLRHAKSSTTADVYVQPIGQSVRNVVEALDEKIRSQTPETIVNPPYRTSIALHEVEGSDQLSALE